MYVPKMTRNAQNVAAIPRVKEPRSFGGLLVFLGNSRISSGDNRLNVVEIFNNPSASSLSWIVVLFVAVLFKPVFKDFANLQSTRGECLYSVISQALSGLRYRRIISHFVQVLHCDSLQRMGWIIAGAFRIPKFLF